MINTVQVKQEQLRNGSFKIGSGETVVLIIGSCRAINYVNYLKLYNDMVGNKYTIHHIDPFNHNWNEREERIDYEAKINSLETNPYILDLLKSTKIYIHEYYNQFGMFNSSRENPKNIYQFGLNPEVDICVPNFNDLFIFFNDIVKFDKESREMAQFDYQFAGKLSETTMEHIKLIGQKNIHKFYDICKKSSIPEMAEYFETNWRELRMFWTSNHISKNFSLFIFKRICQGLNLETNEGFLKVINEMPDLFENPHTHITKYDIECYGIKWNDEIKPLAI